MVYLPSEFINSNYRYSINNYYYTVRTNKNCYTQYSTTYCDCYDIYFDNSYLSTLPYSCNFNTTTNINYNNFTDNFYYRQDFDKIMIIFFIIVILAYYLAFKPVSRLLGRWLKI